MKNRAGIVTLLIVYLSFTQSDPSLLFATPISPPGDMVSTAINQQSSSQISITMEIENIEISTVEIDGEQFEQFSLGRAPTLGSEGYPDLPFISRCILIPQGAKVSLNINNVNSHIEKNINPVISPRIVDGRSESIELSETLVDRDEYYPPQPIELGEISVLRGYFLINFRFYPVQTNSVKGHARINDKIDFTLSYDLDGSNHQLSPRPRLRSLNAYRSVVSLVENPPPSPERDDIHTGSYLYIAPNADGVADAIAPLIEWRRRQGFNVSLEMVANGAGAGTINDLIEDYYNSAYPVEYVALVGDAAGNIRLSAASQFGDYGYTRLDGNDPLPDVALGRISVSSINELNRVVNKLVSYESDPYMDDTDWFKQAASIAGAPVNGLGTVLLAKYVRKELFDAGYDQVHYWYHNERGILEGNQQFLTDQFDWGISVMHYRAYSRMNGLSLNIVRNLPGRNGRWAAMVAISCNTGTFVTEESQSEAIFRGRGGGIGVIGTATPQTNVKFNNIMAGGVWKGILKDKLYQFGWGFNKGKYELWRAYAGFDGGYINFMEWNNLIGDPGTHIWTDIPRVITADNVRDIPVGSTYFSIHAEIEDQNETVNGALVCLYKDDELQLIEYTDDEGNAEFTIKPEQLTAGTMLVTITKHNHKPYLADIDVIEPDSYIGVVRWDIDDDDDGESIGNDNGVVNPGEKIELTVYAVNFGENVPDGEVTFELRSLTPWAEVLGEPVQLNEAPDPGEEVELSFVIDFDPTTPDFEPLPFQLITEVGEDAWISRIDIVPESPKIQVARVNFIGGELEPGSSRFLDVSISNIGHSRLASFEATILSSISEVRAIRDRAAYLAIQPNQMESIDGTPFRLIANGMTIPGISVSFELLIESDSGFRDTTHFEIVVGQKDDGDPLGPDAYGYICLDSGDEDWELAPEYDWIEIDPDVNGHDFNGDELNLQDRDDNQDVSTTVDLPFDFQYYGEVFDQITICSNGWAAFGDQEELADFRNRRIAQALGPNAQLCVWWDNLLVPDDASITTAYDEEGGRFIIEWNNVERLIDGGVDGARETFEIVLYDIEDHPTTTGDGKILFQYKEVTNENRRARNDTPFCTIGIGNLDDSAGIEYTYWNQYPVGAEEIGDEMALLFITQSDFRVGVLEGVITDEETGNPVSEAEIMTSRVFWAETNEQGFYRIDNIILGEDYDITAFAQGWNDSTQFGFDIVPDETLTVDFSLLHPEINFDVAEFELRQYPNDEHVESLNMSNSGNGMLDWKVAKRIRGQEEIDPWNLRDQIQASQEIQDGVLYGAIFTGDHFYIAGRNDEDPQIYVLDEAGQLVRQFSQFVEGERFGMRDLAWDGRLIWGSVRNVIYGFTIDGDLEIQFDSPVRGVRRLAWDADRELLWISSTVSHIFGVDIEGQVIEELDNQGLRIYGLAYWPEDPDEHSLYVFSHRPEIDDQILYKMNPDTEDTMFVRFLDPDREGTANGAFISNEYDPYNWSFISSLNDVGNDRIDVWHLGPRLSWISAEPREGEIEPDDLVEIMLTIDTELLPHDTFEADLIFTHNAGQGESIIRVAVEVLPGAGEERQRILNLRDGWNLISLNIELEDTDVEVITRALLDAGILNLVKNGRGQFYAPDEEFNNLPPWDFTEGYQINVSEPAELIVDGLSVDPQTAIQLEAGWNMTAYLPRPSVDAAIALGGIADQLEIAKDGLGRFYLPEFDFSNMGYLEEGYGYKYKVTEAVDLVYSLQDQLAVMREKYARSKHFSTLSSGEFNMSILVISDACDPGWELGVFGSEGQLLGGGVFDEYGRCGVAAFTSDHAHSGIGDNGFEMIYRVWDGENELHGRIDPIKGENRWVADGVLVGNLMFDTIIPVVFGIYSAYPNPFNSHIQLKYGLVDKGHISLKIFDVTGREAAVLIEGEVIAGVHSFDWNPAGLSSGVYFVRLAQAENVAIEKIMLLK